MGDIVSLVEKAAREIDQAETARMAEKMQKGIFDLQDLADQLKQMEKLGGMSGIMGMMPGVGKLKKQMSSANLDDKVIKRQVAIIQSMTPHERRKPEILKASRKKRIAAGSGVDVSDVNKLLKMHRQMADMMKQVGKGKGLLGKMMGGGMGMPGAGAGGPGAGMPQIDPREIEKMARSGKLPGGMPGLPGGLGSGFPGGAGPKLPGMGGLPGLGRGKKK
jgi:signal recognition particle subunit SRP54